MNRTFGRHRFTAAWLTVLVLSGCLWWALHPPRSEDHYRQESADTVELLRSNVETTRIWLDARAVDRTTSNAVEVALTETEGDADRTLSGYTAHQPPSPTTTELRSEVATIGDRVVTLLGQIRVDARSGRWDAALAARDDLEVVSRQLAALQRKAAP
jgi:hypothetical protein